MTTPLERFGTLFSMKKITPEYIRINIEMDYYSLNCLR